MFSTVRLAILGAVLVGGWFIYSWGFEVIRNYTAQAKQIERLERDKRLIKSRVASLRTLLARRDAAIRASQCKDRIERWIQNPDTIPTPFDPFNQLRD